MKKIVAVLFILLSEAGYSGDYFICSGVRDKGVVRYIFSTDGKTAMERFVSDDSKEDNDILWGYHFDVDVKSVTGSQDHYELTGNIPDGHFAEIVVVVDKDANGNYVATYKQDTGVNEQSGSATCRRTDAIYRHKNDFNFFTFSQIPTDSLNCRRGQFTVDFNSKRVWGEMGKAPTGNYFGGEYFITSFEKQDEGKYSILLLEKGLLNNYQIKLNFDSSSNKWKFRKTDLVRGKTRSGECEIL